MRTVSVSIFTFTCGGCGHVEQVRIENARADAPMPRCKCRRLMKRTGVMRMSAGVSGSAEAGKLLGMVIEAMGGAEPR